MDKSIKTGDSVLDDARERYKESEEVSSENRTQAEADVRFARMSDQWPDDVRSQREEENRPCLTINRLKPIIAQVVNDARQNKPGITVSPVDNGADENTAEVIGGLIRSIERNGEGAALAYDTAIENAISGGFGFFRIDIDYAHEDSFEMECIVNRIPNPMMVHHDVNSTSFDASDWGYAFVSELLTKENFKSRYPNAEEVDFEGMEADLLNNWMVDDSIRVAEYWLREEHERTLYQLSNGMAIREDDIPKLARRIAEAGGIDLGGMVSDDDLASFYLQTNGLTVARSRKAKYYEVTRRIMSGIEILEEDKWPGSMIPICPVWGEEVFLDGKRHFRSMIRDAKDPQRMFNFWRSATTELVALAPKAPWLVEKDAIPAEEEHKWETANSRSWPYLKFEGSIVPQRQPFAGVPAGALQEAMSASDDIKSSTGVFDAALGARSNETSGRAIMARQRESDVSNFHFIDNLNRAIRYAGRVLVEIIPSVYSPKETIRILGEDSKESVVHLTQEGDAAYREGVNGQPPLYNLDVGKYDVDVKSGPSYSTQREETREALVEIMSRVPGAGELIGDVVLEHMDFQGADKVAKRLQALLPEQIRLAEQEGASKNLPPEAQQIVAQSQQKAQEAGQQVQQLSEAMKQLQDELKAAQSDTETKRADIIARSQAEAEKIAVQRQDTERKYQLEQEKTVADIAAKARQDELKARELDIKEAELASEEADRISRERQAELDRQAEIAKIILSRQETPDAPVEFEEEAPDPVMVAMLQATQAMAEAANIMAAPKSVVRDPSTGAIVGVEPIVEPASVEVTEVSVQ